MENLAWTLDFDWPAVYFAAVPENDESVPLAVGAEITVFFMPFQCRFESWTVSASYDYDVGTDTGEIDFIGATLAENASPDCWILANSVATVNGTVEYAIL